MGKTVPSFKIALEEEVSRWSFLLRLEQDLKAHLRLLCSTEQGKT